MHRFLRPLLLLDVLVTSAIDRAWLRDRERGQATTEYVLVLLGVAAIAIAVATWAASSGKIGQLLDRVFDNIDSEIA